MPLAENEILEVLFADSEYKAALDQATEQTRHDLPDGATRIPIAIWSRLRFDLAPYLTERAAPGANVLTFYHRQVAEWVQEHFVKASEHSWQPHWRLADYFTACAKGTAEEWESDSVRGFAECIYQFVKAGQHEQAAGFLSNFPFLLHKLRVGLLESVFEDYGIFQDEAPANVVKQLEIWADFFREKVHILRRGNEEWPAHKILLQLAVEHADNSRVTEAAESWVRTENINRKTKRDFRSWIGYRSKAISFRGWLWLKRCGRPTAVSPNPCLQVLEGHRNGVNGVLFYNSYQALSWSRDSTLRLWDTRYGQYTQVFQGHGDEVVGSTILPSGDPLSWSHDGTLKRWDCQNGRCLTKSHLRNSNGRLTLMQSNIRHTGVTQRR